MCVIGKASWELELVKTLTLENDWVERTRKPEKKERKSLREGRTLVLLQVGQRVFISLDKLKLNRVAKHGLCAYLSLGPTAHTHTFSMSFIDVANELFGRGLESKQGPSRKEVAINNNHRAMAT